MLFLFALASRHSGVTGFAPTARSLISRSSPIPQHQAMILPTNPRTTTQCRSAIMELGSLKLLRGGAEKAVMNLSMESYKLQSMATYSTITALIMNACLRMYTSQKFPKNKDDSSKKSLLEFAFTACTTGCVLSGVFTAVVFNLLGIYSKEAIGMGNNAGYIAFRNATHVFRQLGFRCFLFTCLSFIGSFGISVWEKCRRQQRGFVFFALSTVSVLVGAYHIQVILNLATEHIYTPEFCAKNSIRL